MIQETTKTGKELERWVADAYRQMGARKVEHDVPMAGNQIDVYVELETPGRLLHCIAIEVKDWSKPVGIDVVNGFATITKLLRQECLIDEGIIVSASGFSRPAREAAETYDVRLLEPADLEAMVAEAQAGREPAEEPHPEPAEEPHLEPAEPLPTLSPDVPATICIPAGPFWIGSLLDDPDAHENETPRRRVNLPAYEIGRYPVTNAQYARFLADNPDYPVPYSNEERAHPYNWDSEARSCPEDKADHPVVLVSWEDAVAYCQWLSDVTSQHYRLPTEQEWEKAARGGLPETRRYPWGDECQSGWCNMQELGRNGTTSVYEFERTNHSPFGVVDMAGNVWEWTASWYKPYPGSLYEILHHRNPRRVVRGGAWQSHRQETRISCRGRYKPDTLRPYLGFRAAVDVSVKIVDTVPETRTPDRAKLRRNLRTCFDESELRDLCFDIGIDYDSLRGEGKGDKARELVAYLERRGRLSELIEVCEELRPKVPW
jgi:formylglycine-generating enzyme required for sulfatase activity